MKQKHLLSLLQTGFTTIHVVFDNEHIPATPAPTAHNSGQVRQPWAEPPVTPSARWTPEVRKYTYKADLADNLQQGDAVVVESPKAGLVIARVVAVDPTPRIDVDADFDYKWIVQKVDRTAYDKRNMGEREFQDTLQEVERVKQREILVRSMAENLPAGTEARRMFDEAIAMVSGKPAIAAPVTTGEQQA